MMMDGKPEEPSPGEDDAALWSLLERAPRPGPVSPYFARRVLREAAALEGTRPAAGQTMPGWLTRLWQAWHGQARGVFAGALAAVVLLAAGTKLSPARWRGSVGTAADARVEAGTSVETVGTDDAMEASAPASPSLAVAETPVNAQDVEIIADLDNLLSREESRLWTDEDTARF